jgi:hypothetical protein
MVHHTTARHLTTGNAYKSVLQAEFEPAITICDSFYDAVVISDYTALNGRMTDNNDIEGITKEAVAIYYMNYFSIYMKRQRKMKKIRITGVPAKNRTDHFLNTWPECYGYTILLGEPAMKLNVIELGTWIFIASYSTGIQTKPLVNHDRHTQGASFACRD